MNLTINKDMTVDSRTIAAGCGIHHQTVIRIIERNRHKLKCLLVIAGSPGKPPEMHAILTEKQTRALIGLFRPTVPVLAFAAHLDAVFAQARADEDTRAALTSAKDMLARDARLLQIAAHIELRLIEDK